MVVFLLIIIIVILAPILVPIGVGVAMLFGVIALGIVIITVIFSFIMPKSENIENNNNEIKKPLNSDTSKEQRFISVLKKELYEKEHSHINLSDMNKSDEKVIEEYLEFAKTNKAKYLDELNIYLGIDKKFVIEKLLNSLVKINEQKLSNDQILKSNIDKISSDSDSTSSKKGYIDELRELKSLVDDGIITEEEYTSKKKSILNI